MMTNNSSFSLPNLRWPLTLVLASALGCAAEDEPGLDTSTGGDTAGTTSHDHPNDESADSEHSTGMAGSTGSSPMDSSGSPATDTGSEDSTGDTGDAVTNSIVGSITRTAEPTGSGMGSVYVAVFADNPITNMEAAVVGQAVLEDIDMTDASRAFTYIIEDVPVRPEAYHVIAFLDDDANADAAAPGPDMGDLVTLDGAGSPTVIVTAGDPVAFNLVLNAVMPF